MEKIATSQLWRYVKKNYPEFFDKKGNVVHPGRYMMEKDRNLYRWLLDLEKDMT